MANYRTSRILPIILVVVIIIIAIAALVSLARVVFFSNSNTTTAKVDISRDALLNTAEGRSVSMTVRGPIVADEEFRSYKIDISSNNRVIRTYAGYLDTVLAQDTLGNSVAAYDQFVHALDKANLTQGKQFDGEKNDIRGICATGSVYVFQIMDGNSVVKDLWTSTCSGSKGSLDASVTQLMNLFTQQIPDSETKIQILRI